VGRAEEDSQLSRGSENTCSPAGKLHAHPSIPRAAVVARCQVNEAALKTRRLPVCAVVDGVVWQCFLGVGMHHISSTQIRTVAFFFSRGEPAPLQTAGRGSVARNFQEAPPLPYKGRHARMGLSPLPDLAISGNESESSILLAAGFIFQRNY
jgi:hypothetical protein